MPGRRADVFLETTDNLYVLAVVLDGVNTLLLLAVGHRDVQALFDLALGEDGEFLADRDAIERSIDDGRVRVCADLVQQLDEGLRRRNIVLNRDPKRQMDSGFFTYDAIGIQSEALSEFMVRVANDRDDCRRVAMPDSRSITGGFVAVRLYLSAAIRPRVRATLQGLQLAIRKTNTPSPNPL